MIKREWSNGDSDVNLSIFDNTTTNEIFNQTVTRTDNNNVQTLTYTAPVTLTAANTYDVTFTLWETLNTSIGHYEGFDSLAFNGSAAVPEPSNALIGPITCLLLFRRRRS